MAEKKEAIMINVLVDGEKKAIDCSTLDRKKHLHVSGREFTEDEVKALRAGKAPVYKTK